MCVHTIYPRALDAEHFIGRTLDSGEWQDGHFTSILRCVVLGQVKVLFRFLSQAFFFRGRGTRKQQLSNFATQSPIVPCTKRSLWLEFRKRPVRGNISLVRRSFHVLHHNMRSELRLCSRFSRDNSIKYGEGKISLILFA